MSEKETMAENEYKTTKEECEANIRGVCEGCGGKLTPIETVDNSGAPTFWQGCERCSSFRSGVDEKYFKVARYLVEAGELLPYGHMCRRKYEDSPERLAYYLDTQTAGLSHTIWRIDHLLSSSLSAAQAELASLKAGEREKWEALRKQMARIIVAHGTNESYRCMYCEYDFRDGHKEGCIVPTVKPYTEWPGDPLP